MSNGSGTSKKLLYTFLKVLIFLLAIYVAFLILRPLLIILLGISFWIIKILVFLAVAILVIHLFLRLIFGINLLQKIGFGRKK